MLANGLLKELLHNRNLLVLFGSQLVFSCGSIIMVTLGGIVGSKLASDKAFATLPMSLTVVGMAVAAIPAALLMARVGRRLGFACGAGIGSAAGLTAAVSLQLGSFTLFTLAGFMMGMTLAFGQQFRFAAAESVSTPHVSYAVSFILLGSIGGAFIGPALAANSPLVDPQQPYRWAMLCSSGLFALAMVLLLAGYRNIVPTQSEAASKAPRALRDILTQPLFVVAVLGGIVGQGVMAYVMTATPLSMHVIDGHSLAETASVIRAHVLAMFLPSLLTAPLISLFGTRKLMLLGVVAMLTTLVLGLQGQQVMHYWWALVLLGIGWNFLFIGGTTLLVRSYQPAERFKAQAFNDFSVFAASAAASLLAGVLLYQLGWQSVLITALPLLVVMLFVLLWSLRVTPDSQPVTTTA